MPRRWRTPDLTTPLIPLIPVQFAKDEYAFNFFSTVTVLGTPQDVTLQELRIECFFPSDQSTAEASRQLARHSGSVGSHRIEARPDVDNEPRQQRPEKIG